MHPLNQTRPIQADCARPIVGRSKLADRLAAPFDGLTRLAIGVNDNEDAAALHGAVYGLDENGHETLLQYGSPERTLDLPADAVRNNRVVLAVEGLWESLPAYQSHFHKVLQGEVNVGQPVLGVHEGNNHRMGSDLARMLGNLFATQRMPRKFYTVYRKDPAVRAVHDLVGQALDRGHDVLLVPHSGGGPEAALALRMLCAEGRREDVARHVRVLALATAMSPQGYTKAGVKPENLYSTGDVRDPVWSLSHAFTIDRHQPWSSLKRCFGMVGQALANFGGDWHHYVQDVFAANPPGAIQAFVDGGPGGIHPGTGPATGFSSTFTPPAA